MQFNSNGKLARFYLWFPPVGQELPKDFCTYFWGLIGRVFLIVAASVAACSVLFVLAYALYSGAILLWAHKATTLTVVGGTLLLVLSLWFDERKKKIKVEILSEAKTIIKGKVDAVKNRYCPRIEWR